MVCVTFFVEVEADCKVEVDCKVDDLTDEFVLEGVIIVFAPNICITAFRVLVT